MFYDYQSKVHECERKLQNFVISLGLKPVSIPTKEIIQQLPPISMPNGNLMNDIEFAQNENVIVIDPTKCYTSSDEENDENDDDDEAIVDQNAQEQTNYKNESLSLYQPSQTLTADKNNEKSNVVRKSSKLNVPDGFRNIFFCQYCESAFVTHEECTAHENNGHDPLAPNACNFCDFRCASRVTIIAHIKECHEREKPYVCVQSQCNKKFGRRSDLKKHSISHTGIRPFTCKVCNKGFSRNTNLTKHMKIHEGLNKPFACQQCPRSFSARCDLQRHEQIHSDSNKSLQCTKCPSAFVRREQLQLHERNHLKDEEEMVRPFKSENMIVSLNPYQDMDNLNFDTSLGAFQGEGYDKFTLKDTSSTSLNTSSSANEMSPDKKPFLNNFSGFPIPHHFGDNVIYPNHVTGDAISFKPNQPRKINELPRTLACDKCPKMFSKLSSLRNHKNVHVNQAFACPVICSFCHKTFKSKRELNRHELIHSGVKKFQCVICLKRFLRKDKLVRHEKIHSKDSQPSPYLHSNFNRMEPILPTQISKVNTDENEPTTLAEVAATTTTPQHVQQPQQLQYPNQEQFFQQPVRPQFYAEYDISSMSN